jgi:hypothetical protein
MLRRQRKERGRITPTPPITTEDDSPDRRSLLNLLRIVLAGFERIRSTRIPREPKPSEWLERWDDEEYTYLEARISGGASELEVDLNVYNGLIFARIRRRRADSVVEAGPPRADLLRRVRRVRA